MWKFYTYCVGALDAPRYIGKGSGNRLSVQARRFGETATELARFRIESDAYEAERQAIEELNPELNAIRGGSGGCSEWSPGMAKRTWEREWAEMKRCGTRLIAAAILAEKGILMTPYGVLNLSGTDLS
jgi:hypothetical protein